MTTRVLNARCTEPIFGQAPQVLQSAATLLRLIKLDNALPRNKLRQKAVEDLAMIWIEGRKKLTLSKEDAKNAMGEGLKKQGLRINSIYAGDLEAAETAEDLDRCALRFLKDTKSVQICPVKKSYQGQNGPTFLISYPRLDEKFRNSELQNYVLKWTQWNELCSTRIYDAFSRYFTDGERCSSFVVPHAAALDLDHSIHEMTDGSQVLLPSDTAVKLRKKFEDVLQAADPRANPKDRQIMLLERIAGSNLFDFASTKYKDLSVEQKQKLFTRLARLAMLDVLMGNLDRLIKIDYDDKSSCYKLVTYESNLGNAMVVWSSGDTAFPDLYAIDNGVDKELIDSSEQREKYNTFLKELFANPKMTDLLTDAMLASMRRGINLQAEDEDVDDLPLLRKQLKVFTDDFETIARPAVHQGLEEMSSRLKNSLLPLWSGEQGSPLKQHLSWAYPELLQAVSERVEIFQSVRM